MFNRELDFEVNAMRFHTPEWFRAERYDYCDQDVPKNKKKGKKNFRLPIKTFFSFFL